MNHFADFIIGCVFGCEIRCSVHTGASICGFEETYQGQRERSPSYQNCAPQAAPDLRMWQSTLRSAGRSPVLGSLLRDEHSPVPDRSLNRILHRKIRILTTLLSNQIIANAYTNSHVNNIFSDGGSDSESSSTSNAVHKKSKKNRRSPQKEENASKKIKQSFEYQINTSNRFANLENEQDHYENQSNLDDEMKDLDNQQGLFSHTAKTPSEINLRSFQNSQPGPSTANNSNNANKSRYVPPIYIDNPKNVPQLLDLLSEITKEKITGRMMNNDKLKIFPPTPEAHKAIQNKITQDGMKSHTYELNDEKQIKVVIRGLSKDFDTSVIISHLQNQGFAPTLCHPIRNRQSNTNFNLFLVNLTMTYIPEKNGATEREIKILV
ncbi:hypothetical protein AVEN_166004-1 [Araneus ventricosus]|uniref:Pre-C2HC domain-containing protein n=1 Tax=Araneus ventricosus TaxID=182803 RepID=A0A4Y2RGL0_ARAVE|nr:hypothetical protein AVEN_166004-1 [Araneus ventricosus]